MEATKEFRVVRFCLESGQRYFYLLQLVVNNINQLISRKVAAVVGKTIALSPAQGNICRLMTKHLHVIINERSS